MLLYSLTERHQKNKPGKIVIVYDDDEKLAPSVTTSLLQKDVENVIMLSGGIFFKILFSFL